jgi:hypothetical protein
MTCTANSSTLSPRLKEIEEIFGELKMNPLEEIFKRYSNSLLQPWVGYRLQEQVNNLLSRQHLKFQSIQH